MEFELISIIGLSVYLAICLISHIVLTFRGGKAIKIVFCLFSFFGLLGCLFAAFIVTGVFSITFLEPFIKLKSTVTVPILIVAIAITSSAEFSGLLHLLTRKNRHEKKSMVREHNRDKEEIQLIDNYRKSGERKHGEYKIVRMG